MQQSSRSPLEAVNPLIKLVKEREDLYFQLLAFVNKNIQSSSNDLDNLTIFNNFMFNIKNKASVQRLKQTNFVQKFQDMFQQIQKDNKNEDHSTKQFTINSRQMFRLSSRLIEILQASSTKARKSVFDDNGRVNKQFTRFKLMLHKILKRDTFIIKDYVEYIINFCYNKYNKQILKIQKYISRVQQGQEIYFRQIYLKEGSDVDVSPDKKIEDLKIKIPQKKIQMTQHLSSTQEHQKKNSLRKTAKSSLRKRRPTRKDDKQSVQKMQNSEPQTPLKQKTVNKLLKFYALLQLNKKQFAEDYVYSQIQKQKHKAQLYSKLMERNRDINKQINVFIKKSSSFIVPLPSMLVVNNLSHSSGQDKKMERNQSISSKRSLRTSFVITKKKSKFQFQSGSSGTQRVDTESNFLQKTIKNINPRRRPTLSTSRGPLQKSKKLFVVKAPMLFEQQIIPKAQMTQANWLQPSLAMKGKQKKNQNIRLKRKNNINPMQNTFLQQNFRYPQ